jgi:hypothetical protein
MNEWSFFTVSSHGSLSGGMMVVPPNTYILNIATAGLPCFKVSWAIENWIYEHSPLIHAPSKTIFQKLYESIKAKRFLREISQGISHIYEPGDTSLNALEQYNENMARKEQQTIAFYEPGDLMFDTTLNMNNHNWPMFLMGAYEIPVPYSIKRTIFEKNAFLYDSDETADTIGYEELIEAAMNPIREARAAPNQDDHKIFDVDANILRPDMFPTGGSASGEESPAVHNFVLSDVITKVNTRKTDGKKHLFIVRACRVAPTKVKRNLMRRFSIASRERPRVKIEEGSALLRTKLNLTFLEKVKTALERKKPSVGLFQKASIDDAIEQIDSIKDGKPFTMDTVKDILERANSFVKFQDEFKALMGLP